MKKLTFYFTCLLPITLCGQVNFIENTIIKTEKTPINVSMSNLGPAFVEDELWFSSFSTEEGVNQEKAKGSFYKLFASPVNETGYLKEDSKKILEKLSSGYHAGPVSFCGYTNELFLTLSNHDNAEVENVVFQKKNIPLKIVVLGKKDNSWVKTGELPFNSPSYSVGHPTTSATGDTLIFASDITGEGNGNTDLYMSIRENGKWGEMINLGNKINTRGKDMFPYLHKGKILFYASNGNPEGMGGFDLWYSVLKDDGFSEPINLSALNSAEDDFGLVVHPMEEIGYFVSNRLKEGGKDEIYQVFFNGEYNLELFVQDKTTKKPVSGVQVEFNDNTRLTTNAQGIIRRKLEKATNYIAATKLDGYMNQSISFTTKNKSFGTIKKELNVEKVETGQKFVMNNIYFHFNKWDILAESQTELNKLITILKDNPTWKVELGSHTDCRGPNAYNDYLSQKRSESAVNYIKSKGIENSRIIAKGYGETQLINHCQDAINCTEEEHRLNRRTEFTILEL